MSNLTRLPGIFCVQCAFQYTFAQKDIATCLVGLTTTEHLETNLKWLNSPLDEALVDKVQVGLTRESG
jgi:aryl-alcohol dehydrogenase-like predicted oxidoreductase